MKRFLTVNLMNHVCPSFDNVIVFKYLRERDRPFNYRKPVTQQHNEL